MDASKPSPVPPPAVPSNPSQWTQQFVNAMSHLYRGELGRIMVWRQRLDATTTWAIGTTTTIIGISFTYRDAPHILFVMNMVMCWILLWIEGRRYRFYDAFRARVRVLEAHFFVPLLKPETSMLEGGWRNLLCEDLLIPSFKMSALEAVGRRLKRNYIWLYGVILVCWITKIFLHPKLPIDSLGAFYREIGYGALPSWLILLLVVVFHGFLTILLAYTVRKGAEEVGRPSLHKKRWKI